MSDNITRKKNTGEPGNGGEFGHTAKPAGDCELTAAVAGTDTERVIAAIKAAPFVNDLTYIDRDDRLTDDQVTLILAGNYIDADNDVDEYLSDNRYDNAVETAREFCADNNVSWSELDGDDQDSIRYAIEERDGSDPVRDLLRNTPDQLMRVTLQNMGAAAYSAADAGGVDVRSGHGEGVSAARVAMLTKVLTARGVDASGDEAQAALEELVANGPWDWHEGVNLDIIWYGDIEQAAALPRYDDDAPVVTGRTLAFENPSILLIDRWNGSGHDVRVPVKISATVTPDNPAALDSEIGGFGWDEVCGLVKSAYRTDVESSDILVPELSAA